VHRHSAGRIRKSRRPFDYHRQPGSSSTGWIDCGPVRPAPRDPQRVLPNPPSCESEFLALVEQGRSNKKIAPIGDQRRHHQEPHAQHSIKSAVSRRGHAAARRRSALQSAVTPITGARHARCGTGVPRSFGRAQCNPREPPGPAQMASPPMLRTQAPPPLIHPAISGGADTTLANRIPRCP
jgi:hypothetical protein